MWQPTSNRQVRLGSQNESLGRRVACDVSKSALLPLRPRLVRDDTFFDAALSQLGLVALGVPAMLGRGAVPSKRHFLSSGFAAMTLLEAEPRKKTVRVLYWNVYNFRASENTLTVQVSTNV